MATHLTTVCDAEYHRLFEIEPEARKVFGMHGSTSGSGAIANIALLIHGQRIISMLDDVFSFIGPDLESLREFVSGLGARHQKYGVKPEYLSSFGRAFRMEMCLMLGSSWNARIERAWNDLFEAFSSEITRSLTRDQLIQSNEKHNQHDIAVSLA